MKSMKKMDNTKITWGITVYNELTELTKLLNFLQFEIGPDDEILIQMDSESVTDDVREYVNLVVGLHHNHRVIEYPLNNNFGKFKTNLIHNSKKEFLFQLDADEIPSKYLMERIHDVLEKNPNDLTFVPRINTVTGLTDEHVKTWNWSVNDDNYVNYPDYQGRIVRVGAGNNSICWMNSVHEQVTNYDTFSAFPADYKWSLIHDKSIEKQTEQNTLYSTM